MTEAFDPYRRWLGIPSGERPPNHYALLGLSPFEEDPDAIANAADRQMAYVRTLQTGPQGAVTQQILNELAAARLCLLDAAKKTQYDADLKARQAPAVRPTPPAPVPAPVAIAAAPLPVPRVEPLVVSENAAADVSPSIVVQSTAPRDSTSSGRLRKLHGWVAPAAGGLAAGLLLAWMGAFLGGGERPTKDAATALRGGGNAAGRRSMELEGARPDPAKSSSMGKKAGADASLASLLRSIERPSPLGVTADKLVIWNTHNGPHNERGALECSVRLLAGGREVWSKERLAMPWAPNEDRGLTVALPPERFDCVRVEISKWEKNGGGLAEIQVLSADGRNLALGCPATASGVWSDHFVAVRVSDGVTTSSQADVGYWVLPDRTPGWIEVDLSLPRPAELSGVTADKLVIWNQHNGAHNDFGTRECAVRLFAAGRGVWSKPGLAIPWTRDADHSLTVALPPKRFDRVRVDVTKWEHSGAGLAELQVLATDGRNLARDCPALANGEWDSFYAASDVTDGIVSSAVHSVGYWLLPNKTPGWVEIDLACLDGQYGAACRQLGLATALIDGDWQKGLPWLARGDHPALRRLAMAEAGRVYDTPEQLALADAWWDLAQLAEGETRKRLLVRALWRYRQALFKLREFRKLQVQARIDAALPELPERNYLYFLQESELKLGWGLFREVMPISVKGVRSPYGLFLHPKTKESSHAAFRLGKRYRRFRGAAAINDSARGRTATALTFRVLGDGRELWKSAPLKATGASQAFDVDVTGVDKLELFVDCPGDMRLAHSAWLEPRLQR